MLSIKLYHKKKELFKAERIIINSDNLTLFTNKENLNEEISNLKELNLIIRLKDFKSNWNILNEFIITPKLVTSSNHKIKINGIINELDDYYEYDQELLNHISKYWIDKNQITWRNFSSENCKLYLKTSLLWSRVREGFRLKEHYFIRKNDVFNRDSFFINIGEQFVGERGYFGNGIDGMKDCLSNCEIEENTKLFIEDWYSLKNILGDKYAHDTVKVLNQYLQVVIDPNIKNL